MSDQTAIDLSQTPEFAIEEARRGVDEFIKKLTGKDPDNPTVIWRSRMHVLGAAILYDEDENGRHALLEVFCDCSWRAPLTALDVYPASFQDIPDEVLAQAVQPWREHLRLSGRMFRIHRDITKAERKAERAAAIAEEVA